MMKYEQTEHRIQFGPASQMNQVKDGSVALVVTSPPYPMIAMWDGVFSNLNPAIIQSLKENPAEAFELMHDSLDGVWKEVDRVMIPGGIVCINIGDATRTFNERFELFANHSRIIHAFQQLGFSVMPSILWRKPTNAPNKFMGSGMLPAGAYITLEHEWILVFRKGSKRIFTEEGRKNRRESAFFWEERNSWFSDVWDMKGEKQKLKSGISGQPETEMSAHENHPRERSAAFPFEIPYRLIQMFSLKQDIILDPFLGTGTTSIAAMASGRNSVGYEMDPALRAVMDEKIEYFFTGPARTLISERLERHRGYMQDRAQKGKKEIYFNSSLRVPVVTAQETDIRISQPTALQKTDSGYRCLYDEVMIPDDMSAAAALHDTSTPISGSGPDWTAQTGSSEHSQSTAQ